MPGAAAEAFTELAVLGAIRHPTVLAVVEPFVHFDQRASGGMYPAFRFVVGGEGGGIASNSDKPICCTPCVVFHCTFFTLKFRKQVTFTSIVLLVSGGGK